MTFDPSSFGIRDCQTTPGEGKTYSKHEEATNRIIARNQAWFVESWLLPISQVRHQISVNCFDIRSMEQSPYRRADIKRNRSAVEHETPCIFDTLKPRLVSTFVRINQSRTKERRGNTLHAKPGIQNNEEQKQNIHIRIHRSERCEPQNQIKT